MKEGWKYIALKDIGQTQTGTTPSKSVTDNYGDYIPFIRPAELNIDEKGGINYESELKLSENGLKKSRLIKADSILMCCIGSVGKTGYTTRDVCCNQQINTLTPSNKYNSRYIYYALLSPSFQSEIWKIANSAKATLAIISKGKWENLEIPVPPLFEQQRIVSRLDAAFAQIDALSKQAEEALEQGKALFQAELKKLMEKKDGWEEKKLGEIATIKGGKRVPKGYKLQTEPTKHKYIRVADFLDNGTINESNIQYISEDIYKQIKNYTISSKDVYISIAGTIGKSGIIPTSLDGSNLTENACKLVLNNGIYNRYIYYGTINPPFVEQMIAATKVSAQPKLALTRLVEIKISIPPLSEQHRIVQILDSLSQKITQLEQNYNQTLANCQALKQAILKETFE